MKPVRIGCSGWAYREWRGSFYPEKLPQRAWLHHYATQFDTVEINSTFYRLPTERAVKEWIEQTPSGFQFSVKGSRYFTHIKRMLHPEKYLSRFFDAITPLAEAGKLGAVLWQLPPSSRVNLERLQGALDEFAGKPGRQCFEFRHESWFTSATYDLLSSHDSALVIADDERWAFRPRKLTTEWTYVRLHRGYTKAELATWRRRIAAWRARAEVFAYFNNDDQFGAPANARALGRTSSGH